MASLLPLLLMLFVTVEMPFGFLASAFVDFLLLLSTKYSGFGVRFLGVVNGMDVFLIWSMALIANPMPCYMLVPNLLSGNVTLLLHR